MEAKDFIKEFKKLDDSERWQMVIDNQDSGITVNIDNDDIFITFKDNEDSYVGFTEFGYDALVTLLKVIKIKADYV